jgi:hypothetical protein
MDTEEIERRFGRWSALGPQEVDRLLSGCPARWYVVGGWAVELFTGVPRPHRDIDVVVRPEDLALVRGHLAAYDWHCAEESGLTPLPAGVEVPVDAEQFWLRRAPGGPWLVDLLATSRIVAGEYVSTRDDRIRMPVQRALRRHASGVRYLAPEIVLLHKASRQPVEPPDEVDLAAALPLLSTDGRAWLAAALGLAYPDHPWLSQLRS